MFINCPFDDGYAPILQAIAFCVVYLGFYPRLAPENADNAAARLDRIVGLVQGSKYGIHDLSRCKSSKGKEFYRMNMPFELGIDYGCRCFGGAEHSSKAILILEEKRFDYIRALSDISGWDIHAHSGNWQQAVRHVRNWLVAQAGAPAFGPSRIQGEYIAFQEWYWIREAANGASEEDITQYPTTEVIRAMLDWKAAQEAA